MECKYCQNGEGDMISCASCKQYSHPSCLELPEHIVPVVKTYDWQCNDCKFCYACHNIENEKKILFCDSCDRGFHTYCTLPPLFRKPKGDWFCSICVDMKEKEEKEKERAASIALLAAEAKGKKKKKEKEDEKNLDEEAVIVDLTQSQRDKRKLEREKTKDVFSPTKGNTDDEEEKTDIVEEEEEEEEEEIVTPKPMKRKYTKRSDREKMETEKPVKRPYTKRVKTDSNEHGEKEHSISTPREEKVEKVAKLCQTVETVNKETQTDKKSNQNAAQENTSSSSSNKTSVIEDGVSPDEPEDNTREDDFPFAKTRANSSKCLYAKNFSSSNQCPFFGCDGTGNTKSHLNSHVSASNCPLSRESRKVERELLGVYANDETSNPPKDQKEAKKTDVQTPIDNIVAESDIEMFEAAKKKALQEARKEMAPHPDGLKSIIYGDVEIDVWYKSQYAHEYSRLSRIYICEFCLDYMKTETVYKRHMAKCTVRHPPGDEIYRKDELSVFEIDGAKAMVYCQNLCLMSKLFLDHKTLCHDVAPFLFYIMTKCDDKGCHMIGYFSKEKISFLNFNVSCILVLPHHMKQGFGNMLIDFSYLLTAIEGKTGSPERPFSDLGLISYRKYWAERLLNYISTYPEKEVISIKTISEKMAMQATDVISTLQYLGMLKYWKGKHVIALRTEVMAEYSVKVKQRPADYKEIDVNCLTWIPPSGRAAQSKK